MKTIPSKNSEWVNWKETQPKAAVRVQVPISETVCPE